MSNGFTETQLRLCDSKELLALVGQWEPTGRPRSSEQRKKRIAEAKAQSARTGRTTDAARAIERLLDSREGR